MARQRFYKAATLELRGPHFNQPGQLYLPGTEHTATLETGSSYGSGIHYTSHRRVAARWGEVVLEVRVLGDQFLIPERVTPRFRQDIPHSLAMGSYNKYRTDRLVVERIVGLATYSARGWNGSLEAAQRDLGSLNRVLAAHGRAPMRLTGTSLEQLRSGGFQLWELQERDVALERYTVSVDVNVFADVAPSEFRAALERAVEGGVGKLPFVQGVGTAQAEPAHREPIGG